MSGCRNPAWICLLRRSNRCSGCVRGEEVVCVLLCLFLCLFLWVSVRGRMRVRWHVALFVGCSHESCRLTELDLPISCLRTLLTLFLVAAFLVALFLVTFLSGCKPAFRLVFCWRLGFFLSSGCPSPDLDDSTVLLDAQAVSRWEWLFC